MRKVPSISGYVLLIYKCSEALTVLDTFGINIVTSTLTIPVYGIVRVLVT